MCLIRHALGVETLRCAAHVRELPIQLEVVPRGLGVGDHDLGSQLALAASRHDPPAVVIHCVPLHGTHQARAAERALEEG